MSEQDWNTVVFTNKNKTNDKNKQVVITNQEKELLEEDGNVPKIKYISNELAKAITTKRLEKKLTRKQLGEKLAILECIVSEYENGKAVYDNALVNKFKKFLGIGKDIK